MKDAIVARVRLHPSAFHLQFADGSAWAIEGGDEQAAEVVAQLGAAMRLGPCRHAARRLLVVSDDHGSPAGDVVCVLRPRRNDDELYVHLYQVSLAIAREVQGRGGVLLHGALAAFPGGATHFRSASHLGTILAAPGSTGKTTASDRLPHPWHSLCDDTTLVVRDENGVYWAHPWPTWSRFTPGGPGGSWDVQRAVPLKAVFILTQAEDDRVEPVGAGRAVTLLVESAEQVSHLMGRGLGREGNRALRLERFDNLCTLAKAMPTYILHLSLSGAFWREIERVLLKDEG